MKNGGRQFLRCWKGMLETVKKGRRGVGGFLILYTEQKRRGEQRGGSWNGLVAASSSRVPIRGYVPSSYTIVIIRVLIFKKKKKI